MTIRIVAEGGTTHGTRVYTEDGKEIQGVTSVKVSMRPNDFVFAHVEVLVASVDVAAHPLLGLDTIRAGAAAHGYKLVKVGG